MNDRVLFQSFGGKGALCHPEAICRVLLEHQDFASHRFTWVRQAGSTPASPVAVWWAAHPRIEWVDFGSPEHKDALNESMLFVNNALNPPDFEKPKKQLHVNTWHGAPFKRMGMNAAVHPVTTEGVIRSLAQADMLLSHSPMMSRELYSRAYGLKAGASTLVEGVSPREDHHVVSGAETTARELLHLDASVGSAVALWMPTWRGASYHEASVETEFLHRALTQMSEAAGDAWTILLKPHEAVAGSVRQDERLSPLLVDDDVPTNMILPAANALILDYSSLVFDALTTDASVIFYTPDLEEFGGRRGFTFTPESWPGLVTDSALAVGGWLSRAAGAEGRPFVPDPRLTRWRRELACRDVGHSSSRVVGEIVRRLS